MLIRHLAPVGGLACLLAAAPAPGFDTTAKRAANDGSVPVTESEQIVGDVRAAGYDVWYMNCLNEGHGFRKKENRDLYQQIVIMFLEKHIAD